MMMPLAVHVIVVKIVRFQNPTQVDLPIRYLSIHCNYFGDVDMFPELG